MRTSQIGIDLIHSFESFRSKAYKCPAGVWTVGWGSTYIDSFPVVKHSEVTKGQAELQFRKDLLKFEGTIKESVTVELNQNQFDALVSLCYNIGSRNFHRSSVLRHINDSCFYMAGDSFLLWNKAINPKTGKLRVLKGLVRRRKAERQLFSAYGDYITDIPKPKGIAKLLIDWQNRRYMIKPFNMTTICDILRNEKI